MENSAYMPTSLASPALMVLASTAEASRDTLHVQGTPAFPGQTTMDGKESMHVPFAYALRTGLYSAPPENFPGISGHPLHMHNPFLSPAMERGISFINSTGGGAFRPVTTSADERNGFHSAFLPTTAKGSKLDQVTASFSHAMGGDIGFATSLVRSGSPLCVKEESSDKETTSSLELQERLSETPASDMTDGTERSTPDEGRSLRRGKKRSLFDGQGCCCPVCGVTLRAGEVELHFIHEAERLYKIGRAIKKSSKDSSPPKASLGGSSKKFKENSSCNSGDKNTPESRWESYQRVKANRQNRLSARAKGKKRKQADESTTCPVCNERLTGSPEELNAHVEQCLRKREAEGDEDEPVDVEGETYEEYEWAGQTRIRATTLLQGGFAASGFQTSTSRSIEEQDIDLNVDVDDTDTYGQPQYNEADVIPCSTDEGDDEERQALRGALIGSSVPKSNHWINESDSEPSNSNKKSDTSSDYWNDMSKKSSGSEGGSADSALIIESLKRQLRELENQNQHCNKFKCLICMNPYITPLVSVICWHVHCENCWLLSLGAKKLCPQCKSITSPQDLRRLYL